ncbi:hypothetical protein Hanom_Chr06g00514291 [Helianthus anomalus]
MNGRNKKNGTDIGKIGDLSTKYRSYISQISDNIVDIIGTDILTNILYRYLGRGPDTDPGTQQQQLGLANVLDPNSG